MSTQKGVNWTEKETVKSSKSMLISKKFLIIFLNLVNELSFFFT